MDEYHLRYLPQFYDDMEQNTFYIAKTLHNPKAADDLIEAVEKAIHERKACAETFEKYHSRKERCYPYYRIYVKNYIVFYVVIPENDKKVMEIRRFLFGKSNWRRKI